MNSIIQAQISGQTFQGLSEYPGVEISLPELNLSTSSDFDGYFSLKTPENIKKQKLIFNFDGLTFIIENFKNKGILNFGKIELPYFKTIEIEEYESLTELEKKECYPMQCWTELIGYSYSNELEKDYLIWNHEGIEKKIYKFKYNESTKTKTVNWKKLTKQN